MKKIAVLLAILFVAPMASFTHDSNLTFSEKSNSAKSVDADVAVIDLNVTTNSVYVGATPTLSPISHTIKVDILNLGGSTGEGNLTLEVNTGSGFTEVDRRIVSINAAQQESHLLYWDASSLSGAGFSIKATYEVNLTISTDSDMTNDVLTMQGISVSSVENAISISDSLPSEGASLARAQWVGEITVLNTGNEPVNVSAQLSLTSTTSGQQIQIQSSTVNNLPGSLANPTQPENISLTFDATSLEGTYTISGNLLIVGPSGNPLTTTIQSRTISFVALRATLISANNRNVDPGGQTILNFILQNSGDEGDNFSVLSDILGDEDHLGDMDFKVAGTKNGITSLQMDIKITGITFEIMEKALDQAKGGREHILAEMNKAIKTSRKEFSKHTPKMETIKVDKKDIATVIGKGGATIREIVETSGAKVDVKDTGEVTVAAPDEASRNKAIEFIKNLIAKPEMGKVYKGKVVKIMEFGAFVNFLGKQDGLVHISELADKRVAKVGDVVKEGDEVSVKVVGFDRGKVKLSMKQASA